MRLLESTYSSLLIQVYSLQGIYDLLFAWRNVPEPLTHITYKYEAFTSEYYQGLIFSFEEPSGKARMLRTKVLYTTLLIETINVYIIHYGRSSLILV